MNTQNPFKDYFSALSAEQKRSLAESARTSVAYLSQIANGHRKAGVGLMANLAGVDVAITPAMLRPDLFGRAA